MMATKFQKNVEIELGANVARADSGNGYGPEALIAAMRYSFEAVGARAVMARVSEKNERSIAMMTRNLGFKRVPGPEGVQELRVEVEEGKGLRSSKHLRDLGFTPVKGKPGYFEFKWNVTVLRMTRSEWEKRFNGEVKDDGAGTRILFSPRPAPRKRNWDLRRVFRRMTLRSHEREVERNAPRNP